VPAPVPPPPPGNGPNNNNNGNNNNNNGNRNSNNNNNNNNGNRNSNNNNNNNNGNRNSNNNNNNNNNNNGPSAPQAGPGEFCDGGRACNGGAGLFCRRGFGADRPTCRYFVAPCSACKRRDAVCWHNYYCDNGSGVCTANQCSA